MDLYENKRFTRQTSLQLRIVYIQKIGNINEAC